LYNRRFFGRISGALTGPGVLSRMHTHTVIRARKDAGAPWPAPFRPTPSRPRSAF